MTGVNNNNRNCRPSLRLPPACAPCPQFLPHRGSFPRSSRVGSALPGTSISLIKSTYLIVPPSSIIPRLDASPSLSWFPLSFFKFTLSARPSTPRPPIKFPGSPAILPLHHYVLVFFSFHGCAGGGVLPPPDSQPSSATPPVPRIFHVPSSPTRLGLQLFLHC